MNFAEKKQAYQELQGSGHLEMDKELLKNKAPHANALNTGIIDPAKAQREILWALLDVATIEEITASRKLNLKKEDPGDGIKKEGIPADLDKVNVLTEENKQLKSQLEQIKSEKEDLRYELSDSEYEKEDLEEHVNELVEQLEEEKKSPVPSDPDQK